MSSVTETSPSIPPVVSPGPEDEENNLIVNFIPSNMSNDEFTALFAKFGTIQKSNIIYDKATGQSLGYGFVLYETQEAAEAAISELNGHHIGDKILKVSYSKSAHAREANVYVANLVLDVTKEKVEDLFKRYGEILDVKLLLDKVTGQPRGVAFVHFAHYDEAKHAIKILNGTSVTGISTIGLVLKIANKQSQKAGSGSGNAGYRHQPYQTGKQQAAPQNLSVDTCLFVFNIPTSYNEMNLRELFKDFGTVLNARVARANRASKGYGFVNMKTVEEAQCAVDALNGKDINGKKLQVILKKNGI